MLRATVADVVTIVADGSIAGPVADGRLIPLVIIDTSERVDLEELTRLHTHLSPGDVTYDWGVMEGNDDQISLVLQFIRPVETRAILVFSIEHQGILVEAALSGRGLYLQPGRPGDRLADDLRRPKILIELPDDSFRVRWDGLVLDRMAVVIRERQGVSRQQARRLAEDFLDETRKWTRFRMPTQR